MAYLLFGAMALQNSALIWAAGHRVHIATSTITSSTRTSARRGFWFSHIGWMLRHYPSGEPDFRTVREEIWSATRCCGFSTGITFH